MVDVVRSRKAHRSPCVLSRRFQPTRSNERDGDAARAVPARDAAGRDDPARWQLRCDVDEEPRCPRGVSNAGVTAMEEAKLWWLVLCVAFLGGVGMALGL